jgi:hypothetical protein
MSRHVPRRDRWESDGAGGYRSVDGLAVRRHKGQWWAEVAYQVRPAGAGPGEVPAWQTCSERLGPFKRPRNAMVEAERHATLLRNRHGEQLLLGSDHAGRQRPG